MSVLTFAVTFYTPFLSATGAAANGFDATVDPADPVRESTLKGAMSAAAETVLGLSQRRREGLFGSAGAEGPWRWLVHRQAGDITTQTRTRVSIDAETHAAKQDMLLRAKVGLIDTVSFEVWRSAAANPETMAMERLALTASAHAVHHLGAQTSRGLGWIGITGGDPLDAPALARLAAWDEEVRS